MSESILAKLCMIRKIIKLQYFVCRHKLLIQYAANHQVLCSHSTLLSQ